ncbi:Hsp20/alpha crystallin family protein [Hyphomicrobiales bacterium]|jgi:HSP20 family protein|uniref:Heat-shock protein Hsp20 n=1 Tax=Methylocystis echinoides TaxID=29468 RepID=A0A9W6LUY1_9HYPH|nr:Hsp20/alpha crystallin family protein [Methylocystis echinoides]RTM08460.1 MAG: Hsp20/alpha crystallin family protein [Hyphomicrobiales bacterium]GLI95949.1 heat-shock protein Hsp20 [Methylocystis echinoides]CAH1696180.1 Hsp20/alpha crystallin family protein [Hyphomicrobiales bacterium]CAH1696193.1 Hsp20/alpha crystallin family protein [Hyphomicrobiales bacterium]
MSVRDLIPWGRNNNQAPSVYRDEDRNPFLSLHREVNRLFDDVFRGFDSRLPAFGSLSSFAGSWPSVEISETDKEIKVTAEIPGLEEKDVEVLIDDGVLTLKGEKRSETEDKEKQFSERFYGRFERRIPLGVEVEEDKIDARFKSGVLSIVLPKSAKAQSQVKRIAIKS